MGVNTSMNKQLELKRASILIECFLGTFEIKEKLEVSVKFDGRLRQYLGIADTDISKRTATIRLSSHAWPSMSQFARIETIAHEAAHVITDFIYPNSESHGVEWRFIMTLLGFNGDYDDS